MSRSALTAVLALLAVAGASPALAQEKYALLVGIDRYKHPKYRRLQCAEDDIRDLAQALKGFNEVVVLTTSGGEK